MNDIPLLGYSDKLSVRQGETVSFKVSSTSKKLFKAFLKRSISADPNPKGIGIIEKDASKFFKTSSYQSRVQTFNPGSYAITKNSVKILIKKNLTFSVIIFPTLSSTKEQIILALDNLEIYINSNGSSAVRVGDNSISIKEPLILRSWYKIEVKISLNGKVFISQKNLKNKNEKEKISIGKLSLKKVISGKISLAAVVSKIMAYNHFNGKIESPKINVDGKKVGEWDLSKNTSSTTVESINGPKLILKNFPTRAVTGSKWDSSEMNWQHKPDHYAAIHFHEDDIYDFEWETDFKFTIPKNMPSGIYLMKISCEGYEDSIPFFVAPELGKTKTKICVLVSTFTYAIYGNHARVDYKKSWLNRINEWNAYPYNPANYKEYGLSTYNYHSDGSGICHASHRRPLFNLRPGYLTFGGSKSPCSGLRHFQADSHLISWLHNKEFDYEIITDEQLHEDGYKAIKKYKTIITGSHPEYHTKETLDALRDFRDNGGSLNYLGGNGFYWRIAIHKENKNLLEIRRPEGGIRAWASEPGEAYNAFDGTYGGLWRRSGRAPQELVGVGFTAQGNFYGHPYVRKCFDKKFDWVFKGIKGNKIGDFGFSGNGAAGFELDHIDSHLTSIKDITLLAQSKASKDPEENFILVPESQLTHLSNIKHLPNEDILQADMVYFTVPGGGSVFSTGSITFCGSLPWNKFNNEVSTLLKNVISKSIK
ncbi:MAG: N,N-dimethylformamidase beta subunit family domain-containing protein [Candidatus Pelagibacter sp.]